MLCLQEGLSDVRGMYRIPFRFCFSRNMFCFLNSAQEVLGRDDQEEEVMTMGWGWMEWIEDMGAGRWVGWGG